MTKGEICAGVNPIIVSVKEKRVSLCVIIKSPLQARPRPPAMAAPSTTITVTCGKAFIDSKKFPAATLNRITSSFFDFPSNMDLIAFKSAPAQNTPSLPRKVIPRTERSSRTELKTLLKSSIISLVRALRLLGRFNQIVSQPFERSNIRFFVCGRLVMIFSSL